jgi:hypothetical protein
MEIQQILIFALIGAVCMFLVTGGLVSMTGDEDPSTGQLVAGAGIGGILGSVASVVLEDTDGPDNTITKTIMSKIGGGYPDMKTGLPNF